MAQQGKKLFLQKWGQRILLMAFCVAPGCADSGKWREKLISYIEGIQTLEARFKEKGPQREASGRVFLKRPKSSQEYGKLKFVYDSPSGLVVVSRDGTVYVWNSRSNTLEETPLSSTPLFVFMRSEVRLGDAAVEKALEEEEDEIHWTLSQSEDTTGGGQSPQVRLSFQKEPLALKSWVITDPTGNETEVSLENVKKGHALGDQTFQKPSLKE